MPARAPFTAFLALLPFLGLASLPAMPAAATRSAPEKSPAREEAAAHPLAEAAQAVVSVKARALANARSATTLGVDRSGSGVLIEPGGLVLTIGYLILEADSVDVTSSKGRTVPATVVAYDHATGFGLLRPIGPLDVKPAKLGSSGAIDTDERLMIASGAGESGVSVATVVSRRRFAGYWEYLIDGAIFTSPPRLDHSGAALINKEGELVGIGSLFVMDAQNPGERLPGNMFVPVDLLKPVMEEMVATGRQKGGVRPWIGLSSVEDDGRIKVLRVSQDGPAERAGLKPGDIILAIAGQKVEKLEEFYRRLWSSGAPGVEVSLKVLQGVEVRDLKIRSIDRMEFVRKKPTI
jgi:S1-C subfamily serine protease